MEGGAGASETRGQMLQRHKRELRDLKRKKGVKKPELKKLEKELKATHAREVEGFTEAAEPAEPAPPEVSLYATAEQSKGPTRKQKRNKAKAEKDKAFDAALKEGEAMDTKRAKEMRALEEQLGGLRLQVKEVPSDGNCLFFAVADQLEPEGPSYAELRDMAVRQMLDNPDSFAPFLVDEPDFAGYCSRMAEASTWGGHLEVTALAAALKRTIVIHSTDPDVVVGEEHRSEASLHITFHKHYLSAGNHYNSVVGC